MENNNVHVHTFTQTVIPPTCKEKGYTLHKCECGYEHKDNFKPLADHDFDVIEETKPTCTEGGTRKATCKVCGITVDETTPPADHTWGEWIISEFATCTEEGKQTRFCSVCGEEETQAIKPTGHKFAQGQEKKVDGYVEHFCENCGETVKVPTRSTKIKGFIKSHKAVVIIPCILAVIAALVVLSIKFFAPAYHYNKANKLIEQGDYADAFAHIAHCPDYKDSRKIIENFRFERKETEIEINSGALTDMAQEIDSSRLSLLLSTLISGTNSTDITEYDEHGNRTSVTSTSNNSTTKKTYQNEYDENNRLIRSFSYDENGVPTGKEEFVYNKNGNPTQINGFNENGEAKGKIVLKYDENCNLTQMTEYSSTDTVLYTTEFEYDKNGIRTGGNVKNYLGTTQIKIKISIEYEYFTNGIKVKTQYSYDELGISFEMTDTYYNPIAYCKY